MENMGNIERTTPWKERAILVTGGAGFIGSWLSLALLKKGARVIILDKKEKLPSLGSHDRELNSAFYIYGNVCDSELLSRVFEEHKIQTVFHLAAEAIVGRAYENPVEALETNVRGTWTLLEASRQKNPGAEIVIASSDKAYGAHAKLPYREDFALLGENPYDCSKSAADRIAYMYAQSYGLNLAITRCGNVYGGGDFNFSRLVPDVIRSLVLKKPPEIRSDGKFRRDYVHVSDIVHAYIRTAEALIQKEIQAGDAFNFGTSTPRTALEVVVDIADLMQSELRPVILATARYEIKDQYLDSGKARQVLGWAPIVEFSDGLRDTIDWYSNYFLVENKLK